MGFAIGTHSGSFHADDVLAVALLREFVDAEAEVVRTRDLERLKRCDAVVDVGGEFDPARRRFDHHQKSYQGPLSSAGMVLEWLRSEQKIDSELARKIRVELVDYVDAVDNGQRHPSPGVPCFTTIVGVFNEDLGDGRDVDVRFLDAVVFAQRYVRGINAGFTQARRARAIVQSAMQRAADSGKRTLELPSYVPWKPAYFEAGGVTHPTEFVLVPTEDSWRILCIPPEPNSFANKRSLPAEWAGLTDADFERVCGIPGARFCHKNLFIAVFATRYGALEALRSAFGEAAVPLDSA
jgi:uncharacterized UPF0160 family protein